MSHCRINMLPSDLSSIFGDDNRNHLLASVHTDTPAYFPLQIIPKWVWKFAHL